jgi:ADP-L-glycero-D-manno-heptose 6-epimerase
MILVTGSNGFIGRNLVARLKGEGHEVYELDRNRYDKTYTDMKERYDAIPWKEITHVYHLGAITNTTEWDIDLLYHFNIECSIHLISRATMRGIPVYYASSASVYGDDSQWELKPNNFYAMSKATVDMWVEGTSFSAPVVGFRFYNVYGLYENKDHNDSMVWKFISQASKENKIEIFEGSDNIWRDFVCIEDVIDILSKRDRAPGIYDVGTTVPICVRTLADMVAKTKKFFVSRETIPFPKHLRGHYQYFTRAGNNVIQHPYKSVSQWLDERYP